MATVGIILGWIAVTLIIITTTAIAIVLVAVNTA
jgi:hypothetical protein